MTPASAQASIATANTSDPTDVPGKSQAATFSHRNVCFTMDLPSKKIQCSGENHLITSIVQCLGEGHLLCRDCQFTSSPASLTEQLKCPSDGSDTFDDIAETRSFRHTKIPCPSATTFEPRHEPACTWEGPYQEVKSHLDECTGIPDRTKLIMQDLRIKELQVQLTNSEKKQSAMIESLTQKYEALDQRMIQQLEREADSFLPLLTRTVGSLDNAIKGVDKIRTRLDRLDARTGNMEQQFNSAVFRSVRQSAADSLAAEQRYLTNLQRPYGYVMAGSLSPLGSSGNTDKCVDVFLWRMGGFKSWLANAISNKAQCYSPVIYTTDRYCVSGQISAYERTITPYKRVGYLSISIAVWKGQYDERISWPMRKIITVSLVNQIDPANNAAKTFSSDDKPAFHKPHNLVSDGWGFHKFLRLEGLNNPGIVQNDALQIKIKLEDPSPGSGASLRGEA